MIFGIYLTDIYIYDAQDLHSFSDFTDRIFMLNYQKICAFYVMGILMLLKDTHGCAKVNILM